MIRLYGLRNCDACRAATKWLKAKKMEFEFVSIREDGIDEDMLTRWQASLDWETLLNKRSKTWRSIPTAERDDLNPERARRLILRFPTVMKRPVLDDGQNVVIGFDASAYENLGL